MAKLCKLLAIDQWRLKFDHSAAVGAGAGKVAFRPNKADARGNELFADRVNRRVGNLSEELLEVIIEELRLIGEHGKRRVVTHRTERLLTSLGAWANNEAHVFKSITKCLLAGFEGFEIVDGHVPRRGQVI